MIRGQRLHTCAVRVTTRVVALIAISIVPAALSACTVSTHTCVVDLPVEIVDPAPPSGAAYNVWLGTLLVDECGENYIDVHDSAELSSPGTVWLKADIVSNQWPPGGGVFIGVWRTGDGVEIACERVELEERFTRDEPLSLLLVPGGCSLGGAGCG